MAKITVEAISAELEADDWLLVSEAYKNLDEELIFQCPEGHLVYSSWRKIRTKKICPICAQNEFKEQPTKIIPKKKDTKRILALDQATYITGYAIYDNAELIRYGSFETCIEDEIARDHQIKEWLVNMVANWEPDMVGLEGIQYQANKGMGVTIFEMLARLQGILMETCFSLNIPFVICHTAVWRNHCGVKGKTRSDRKKSMQLLVKQWYDVSVTDDCADAVGIGRYVAEKASPPAPKVKMINWE